MKIKIKDIGIIIFILSMILIIKLKVFDPIENSRWNDFHQKSIDGIITGNSSSTGGTKIRLNSEKTIHYIYCGYDKGGEYFFPSFFELGDSIVKKSKADNLYLYRSGQKYIFPCPPDGRGLSK